MPSVTCSRVAFSKGVMHIVWDDGVQMEFSSRDEFDAFVQSQLSLDTLRAIHLAKWRRDNGATFPPNVALIEGTTIDANIANNNLVRKV